MPDARSGRRLTLIGATLLLGGAAVMGWEAAGRGDWDRLSFAASPASDPVAGLSAAQTAEPEKGWAVDAGITAAAAREVTGTGLPPSVPIDLEIPSIGVHVGMFDVGLQADGEIEVPAPGPRYDAPAWYRNSPTPGELGPAVVVGHVDTPSGAPSVFYRLGELTPGRQIHLRRADGLVATFDVTDVRQVGKADFPTDDVYGNLDHAGLRLITCAGPLDPVTGHYRDNIVVFAALSGWH